MVHTTERKELLTSEELLDKTESLINWREDLFNDNNNNNNNPVLSAYLFMSAYKLMIGST